MNTQHTYCDKIRELILLEDSGELPRDKAQELGEHLEKCPDCDAYRNDVNTLMGESRKCLPAGMPSDQAIAQVLSYAADRNNVVLFASPWRILSGIAALFAVILGTYLAVYTPNTSPATGNEYVAGDVQIMMALASDGDVVTPGDNADLSDEARLKELANTLLKLQGFRVEEKEYTGDVTDLFLPTALQWHSKLASPSETSV